MIAVLTLALAMFAQDPDTGQRAGDRMLDSAQANGVFQNVSDGNVVRLKHPASGLICEFDPAAERNAVRIYPVRPGVENRGDDVGCGTTPDIAYTIYATRYRPESSEAVALAQAVEEVESIWDDIQRLDIPVPHGTTEEGFAAFRGRHPNGQMLATVILVRQIGPWTFKMRASGPPDDPKAVVRAAAERFAAQLPQAVATD